MYVHLRLRLRHVSVDIYIYVYITFTSNCVCVYVMFLFTFTSQRAMALLETAWTSFPAYMNSKECGFVGAGEVTAMATAEEKGDVLQRRRAMRRRMLRSNTTAFAMRCIMFVC